jgi:hypothetical protein
LLCLFPLVPAQFVEGGRTYLQIVESRREADQVRQRLLPRSVVWTNSRNLRGIFWN